jgi:hypothetical protein
MIFRDPQLKSDPLRNWNRSDRAFFAAGACHILAHCFLERFPDAGFSPILLLPRDGFRGSHVFVSDGITAFDYHGFSDENRLVASMVGKLRRRFPGWQGEMFSISNSLTGREFCERYSHRMLHQYLHDPLPRAEAFLARLLVKHPLNLIPL